MNFCSNCGAGQLSTEVPIGDNRPRLVCQNCQTVHYHNPKVIVGCLPVLGDKVLLCRRAIEPKLGFWNVPAGFLEVGETVEQGAVREVWEEAQAKVELCGLLTVFSFTQFHHVYLQFYGKLVDGQFGVGEESLESRLFTEAEVPWQEIAFESSVFALQRYFEDFRKGQPQLHIGSI